VAVVLAAWPELEDELIPGFEPAPMMDRARSVGVEAWTEKGYDGVCIPTFRSPRR
jgi:hypothetical protein